MSEKQNWRVEDGNTVDPVLWGTSWSAFRDKSWDCSAESSRYAINYRRKSVNALRVASAGVLPFAKDKRNDTIYFLLGREQNRHTRRGTSVWCDFGGGVSPGTCSLLGASREFAEETLGVVVGEAMIGPTIDFVTSNVCENQPIRSMFGNAVPYDMYLIEIPFDVLMPTKFQQRRNIATSANAKNNLKHMFPRKAFHSNGSIVNAYLEKECLAWVSMTNLLHFSNGSNEWCEDSQLVLRREFAQTISHFSWRIQETVYMKCKSRINNIDINRHSSSSSINELLPACSQDGPESPECSRTS
jgi:hypothetical protein